MLCIRDWAVSSIEQMRQDGSNLDCSSFCREYIHEKFKGPDLVVDQL